MRLCWVVEGDAEYDSLPTLASRMGHQTIGIQNLSGTWMDWMGTIESKVLPRAKILALKQPDKILIVLDREDRPDCPPNLAALGLATIRDALLTDGYYGQVAFVVCDKQFECLLFADFSLVDQLDIFEQPISQHLGASTDDKKMRSKISACLKSGKKYDKRAHSKALARRINYTDAAVLERCRALRKLVSELQCD